MRKKSRLNNFFCIKSKINHSEENLMIGLRACLNFINYLIKPRENSWSTNINFFDEA
jgi:hypothetical protein